MAALVPWGFQGRIRLLGRTVYIMVFPEVNRYFVVALGNGWGENHRVDPGGD